MESAVSAALAAVLPTGDALALLPHPESLLSPGESARAAELRRPVDRDAFVAARVLALVLVAETSGTSPYEHRFVQVCDSCGGPHGRPRLAGLVQERGGDGLYVSWSHTEGAVAAVVAATPCGVDVERTDRHVSLASLAARVLTPNERAIVDAAGDPDGVFLSLWRRKEALVKAGVAALPNLFATDVSAVDASYALAERTLGGGDGAVAATALAAHPTASVRWWAPAVNQQPQPAGATPAP